MKNITFIRKINFYIIKEYFGPVLLATSVLTLLMLLNRFYKLMDLIFSKGLSVILVGKILALSIPFIIAETFPMSVLVSTLMVFGKLSSDNEITAFKGSGISTFQLIKPAIYLSIFFVMLMFWFHNFVLPNSNHQLATLLINVKRIRPIQDLEPGLFNQLLNYDIYVESKDDKQSKIFGVIIYDNQDKKENQFPRIITAEHGKILLSQDEETMVLKLFNGEISQIDPQNPNEYKKVDFNEQTIYLQDISQKLTDTERTYRGDRELSLFDLNDKVKNWENKLNSMILKNENINVEIFETLLKYFDQNLNENSRFTDTNFSLQIRKLRNSINRNEMLMKANLRNINRYKIEFHKKISIPFACFVFVLFGAPIGIISRKGGFGVAGVISLLFFIVYYIGLVSGEDLGDRGIISPFIGMWGVNIVFFIFGIFMITLSMLPSWRWKMVSFLVKKPILLCKSINYKIFRLEIKNT